MEQREFREHHVATAHVQNASKLLDVAHQVALRKFHTLRRTFRARAKHNHSIVVHVAMFHKHKANKPARHKDAKHKESSNLCLRDFLHDIFGIEQAHLVRCNLRVIVATAFQLLHKLAARNHSRAFSAIAAELHVFDRRRVVQVHIRLANHPECEVHNHARRTRREHNTHVLFVFAKRLLEVAAERHHSAHQLVTREMSAIRTINCRTVLHVLLVSADPAIGNRMHKRNSVVPGINRDAADNGADFVRRSVRRESFTKGDRHRTFSRSTEHVRRAVAIVRAPQALDIERDYLSLRAIDSGGIVNRKRFHVRRLGNFARRENHDSLTCEEGGMNLIHRNLGIAVINTDHAQALEHGAQVPLVKMVLVTCNTKRTRRSHLHHSPVNKAVVVTDQENRTIVRDVLHVQHADSIAAEHKT